MNSPLNMRRQLATLSFALASIWGPAHVAAQTGTAAAAATPSASATAPMSFEEALRIAVTTHPTVNSRRNDMQAANARLDAAMRQRYPGFQAQTGKDAGGGDTTTMRLEKTLWNGGRTAADIEGAEAGIRSSSVSVILAQQEIMARVITAFTDLGRVRTRQLVAQSNVQEHERLAALIGRRVESQISPMSDGTMANARLAQARAELNQLSALAERAQSSLTQALGKSVTDIQTPSFPSLSGTNDFLIRQKALDYAPALRRLNAEEAVLKADIESRKSALWPQIKLRAEKNSGGMVNKSQVYVTMDYQTGAGFVAQAQIKEGFAKLDSLRSSREAAERDALEAVNADLADLKSQQMQLKDLRDQVAATTEVFDSSIRQYSVGRKTWVDVLNAQREVSQSRYAQADAEWGYLRSAMRVNLATGDLIPESMDSESVTAQQ
ncbi:TolC family protein [Limnohabitans sp. WS1]|uniref:TolC family protein n=1 Tax=Limnohabitans sp. WS1 TaxID=1100726 RepID=UPI001304AC48|nr:TolC family protein [Limnohabitans sp. WS1]